MASYQKVIVMGNLTRDPETVFAAQGDKGALITFGVAINRRFKSDGRWQEEPVFLDCKMSGPRAEPFARFHGKGSPCLLEGEMAMDTWKDKETGRGRSKLYMRVYTWEFAGGNDDQQQGGGGRQQSRGGGRGRQQGGGGYEGDFINADETPF